MIRIIKGNAPQGLLTRGAVQTTADFEEYNQYSNDYNVGAKKFEAKSSIYNSNQVRRKLVDVQHHKCCYCETKDVRSNSDVEHYRPKAAYSEALSGTSLYPGYFWLAYEWDNLFLACQVCNQVFKNDFFPIENNATRAQRNGLNIIGEVPVLIHPSIDNPEEHIGYRESIPYGITVRGAKTIDYLGFGKLDDTKGYSTKQKARIKLLVEEREKYYKEMELLNKVVEIFSGMGNLNEEQQTVIDRAQEELNKAQMRDSKWSLMIKYAISKNFEGY